MQVFGLPGHLMRNGRAASRLLAAKTPNIEAERRRDAVARWLMARAAGLTAEAAARAVGASRSTLHRWRKRAAPLSRRPRRVRGPNRPEGLAAAIERLRLDFPMWGKAKIGPLVRELGFAVSDATSGGSWATSSGAGGRPPRPTCCASSGRARPGKSGPTRCASPRTSPSKSPATSCRSTPSPSRFCQAR